MASSLITVFQAFSTDSQAYVMWAGIQSEPEWVVIVLIFYFGIAFALGQTLINVFVAVLTTVFSAVREEAAQRHAREKEDEEDGEQHAGVKIGQVVPFDDGDADKPPSSGGQSGGPVEDVPLANVVDGGVAIDPDDDDETVKPEILPPDAAPKTQKFDFPYLFSKIFRNPVAQAFVLIVIFANAIVICLIGTFPEYNALLVEAEYYFSIFFLFEFITQVGCDGSLAKYFNHPEHNFDFLVQLSTTSALIAQSAGASPDNTSVLRSLAIMRLFRACKFFFLRPLWLMLIKMVDVSRPRFISLTSILLRLPLRFQSWRDPCEDPCGQSHLAGFFLAILTLAGAHLQSSNAVFNLVLFITVTMIVFAVMGMSLFGDTLDDPRANFGNFGRAMLTLFQIFSSDSWSGVLYGGMFSTCVPLDPSEPLMKPNCTATNTTSCTSEVWNVQGEAFFCDSGRALMVAVFYCIFLWMGQYVLVSMFLGLILEAFSVEEFMVIERPEVRFT
jgi:hypothetical protein